MLVFARNKATHIAPGAHPINEKKTDKGIGYINTAQKAEIVKADTKYLKHSWRYTGCYTELLPAYFFRFCISLVNSLMALVSSSILSLSGKPVFFSTSF